MDLALGLFAFWPALALGSFLNVVAARVPLRRSVVRPASACMSCGTELAWHDNVPVLSWLVLRGRCRACGVRISAVYPLVELATAALVAGCFVKFGLSGEAFLASFFCVVLVVLSAIDLEHRIVPNRIVLPAARGASYSGVTRAAPRDAARRLRLLPGPGAGRGRAGRPR